MDVKSVLLLFTKSQVSNSNSFNRLKTAIRKFRKAECMIETDKQRQIRDELAMIVYVLYLKCLFKDFPFQIVIFDHSTTGEKVKVSYTRILNPVVDISFGLREFCLKITFNHIPEFKIKIDSKVEKDLGITGDCSLDYMVDSNMFDTIAFLIFKKYFKYANSTA
jgi:hypothetical protein